MCVSCSWLNGASSLQRLLSNTVAQRDGGSGAGHNARPHLLLQAFSYGVIISNKDVHLQKAAKSHTYFKRPLPLIPPVLLQLAIDGKALCSS